MPNQLAKRIRREKTEANRFFVYLFIPSGFFRWQVSGIQPEPAYTNLSEGRGISHEAKLGRAERQENLRQTGDHFSTSESHHLQDFQLLLDSSSPRLRSSPRLLPFLCFCLLAGFVLYEMSNSKSVSTLGREYDHQSLLKFRSGFTSGSSHYQRGIDSGAPWSQD